MLRHVDSGDEPAPLVGGLLPMEFYRRDALSVARDLLGKVLSRDEVVLRITEVEAYPTGDSANHCHRGQTARNTAMFGPPGQTYIYLCYGIHHLLNVVTNTEGEGATVLIRACEVHSGMERLQERRGGRTGPSLLTGPGRVGAGLGLDLSMNAHPLWMPGGLELREAPPVDDILCGPRVGIDYAAPEAIRAPWRLAVAGTRWVSQRKTLRASK